MTSTIKRAVSTIAGLVSLYRLLKARSSFLYISAYMMHMLSHGADETIFVLVIKKLVCGKWVFTIMGFMLLIIKHPIFYKGSYLLLFQQCIVFFRPVTGIGGNYFEDFPKAGLMLRQMGRHGCGIGRIIMNGIVDDKLI